MFDYSTPTASIGSIFSIFLIACLVLAVVIEIIRWWFLKQASGYLFKDTRSTYESETYEQTNPHLMVGSRNEDQGQEFSYSFWILIQKNLDQDANDTKERVLISRGSPSIAKASTAVYLGGSNGSLQKMTVTTRTYTFQKTDSDGNVTEQNQLTAVVNDIPLRRWTHVAVCGRNNALDIFVNGRMAQHVEAPQPLLPSSGPLYANQNGGFDGYMSKLHYGNYYYSHDQIYSMLKSGPSGIPDLNSQYGTKSGGLGGGGGLANQWWTNQGSTFDT